MKPTGGLRTTQQRFVMFLLKRASAGSFCCLIQTGAYNVGFPSPSGDYTESRISLNYICGITANSRVLETSEGYAVIDVSLRPVQGDTLLILTDGRTQFCKLRGRAFISEDGESIEGEALEDVQILGVVTFLICCVELK